MVDLTSAISSEADEVTREILTLLVENISDFPVRLWNGESVSSAQEKNPPFTIVLNHPGALRRMFFPPGELRLTEAYLRGDFDVEGDIISAMNIDKNIAKLSATDWLRIARLILSLPKIDPPALFEEGRQQAMLSGEKHSIDRDKSAVTFHYDVGNEFYELFLGKWMTYSSAYFTDKEMSLDDAQEAKLEHICRKLRLKKGDRLLDVGCGWGSLVTYAAKNYGVNAVGITLSEPQVKYSQTMVEKAGLTDLARVELLDYREISRDQPFDKIVSIGMFEHVGRARMTDYFDIAFQLLRPGGLFLNHGIALNHNRRNSLIARKLFQRGQFAQKYVFPDGELLQINETLEYAETVGFEVRDVESLREHYDLTLQHWVRNLEQNKAEALKLVDNRTARVWRLYMSGAAYGFRTGEASIFQSLLSKAGEDRSDLPLTRQDIYQ